MQRTGRATPGALGRYLADLKKIPRLDEREEKRVSQEIRDGRREAVNELVKANLAFVVKLAYDYRWTGVPVEDLVNAGNIGMIGAARRFDATRNVRFTTYAAFWVRKSILEAVATESRVVRLPAYHIQMQREISHAETTLRRSLGRKPNRTELAAHLSMNLDRLERLLRYGGSEISLDDPVEDTPGAMLRKKLAEPGGDSIDQKILLEELTSSLQRLLCGLDRRQRTVLTLRFGLEGTRPRSLSEIGERLKVSRERVRQIEHGAIRSMRASLGRPCQGAVFSTNPRGPQTAAVNVAR
jgi:RNA polymerase primary sigma factor